ncbi:MAG: hypothetical protein HY287_10860 [Planctomycetes bacterium]|nr:hypothetical protein [Planctomycetota bacterium]
MRSRKNHSIFALVLGVVIFAVGVKLSATPPQDSGRRSDSISQTRLRPNDSVRKSARDAAVDGRGVRTIATARTAPFLSGSYPISAPIVVNYLDDDATRARQAGRLVGPVPKAMAVAASQVANIPSSRKCVGGTNAGGTCTSDGDCPGVADGACTGGHCVGGISSGASCTSDANCFGSHCGCTFAVQCDDGVPCTNDRCALNPGAPFDSGKCVHDFVLAGVDDPLFNGCPLGTLCGGCDDGIACNGKETCDGAGACVSSGPVDCGGGKVCNEVGRCANSGRYCTADIDCPFSTCNHCQTICTTNGDCSDGIICNGNETCDVPSGKCVLGTPPCGASATCFEKKCSASANNPWGCAVNSDCPNGGHCNVAGPVCLPGRCCDNAAQPNCSRRALNVTVQGKSSCNSIGGMWFAGDLGTTALLAGPSVYDSTCPASNDSTLPAGVPGLHCPKYGDGIAPLNVGPLVGPIYDGPVVNAQAGVPLYKLGDDYQFTDGSNILLDEMHFVGGAFVGERIAFELYDASCNFIEDLFFIMNVNTIGLQTILFQPAIEIPPHGFLVMTAASEFAPETRIFWATTDSTTVDVGVNDPDVIWVNGGPTANFLPAPNRNLLFELVGRKTTASIGACCLTAPGPVQGCDNALAPWICEGEGGAYLGNYSLCAYCGGGSNAGNNCRRCFITTDTTCDRDADCPSGELCVPNDAACPGATCVAWSSCGRGACCNPTTGGCTEGDAASCANGGGSFQGFGTTCDIDNGYGGTGDVQSCCPQPTYTGGDNCSDATVHFIHVPAPGSDPVVVTITGDNSAASSTIDHPDSCVTMQCGSSCDVQSDVGWWEAFEIDACAYVRVDSCCTGTGSEVLRPAWVLLFPDCPCGAPVSESPNPNGGVVDPFPEPAFNRGGPYCTDDNIWFWVGPLKAGHYYYPVYSAPLGYHGQYQLHITAQPCPTAACCMNKCVGGPNAGSTCTGNAECGTGGLCQGACSELNIMDCAAAGGYYLGPPNKSPATATCTGTPGSGTATCDNGSCCTAPGVCVDRDLDPPVSAQECLTELNGKFVGGIRCKGGYCNSDYTTSCLVDADCPTGDTCNVTAAQKAQPKPCQICEIQGADNCQPWENTGNIGGLSDPVVGSNGIVAADDFKYASNVISSVCVWGEYINTAPHANPFDCGFSVTADHFRVRVYDDFEGLPCNIIAESVASSVRAYLGSVIPEATYHPFAFQLTLATPVTGLDASGHTIYWLEVSNAPSATISTCVWFWDQLGYSTSVGNHYSATGSNAGYPAGSERTADYSWCLNGPIVPGASGNVIRSCCNCVDASCSLQNLRDCRSVNGIWNVDDQTCGVACAGPPPNDHCTSTIGNLVPTGTYYFDTQCADTDGPNYAGPTEEGGSVIFGHDVWYRYQAPFNCTLIVSMCGTGTQYDSMLGVYHRVGDCNFCPTDANSGNSYLVNGRYEDESCTGVVVAGAGFSVSQAQAGECYVIRAGGFYESRGSGVVDISCTPTGNTVALDSRPLSNGAARGTRCPIIDFFPTPVADPAPDKNRYIAFSVPDPGPPPQATAVEIKRVKLMRPSPPNLSQYPPPDFSTFENQYSYAGTPTMHCQNGGTPPCVTPSDAIYAISITQCAPNYIDWQAALNGQLLYVTGSDIVPSSQYEVSQLAASCAGNERTCTARSAPCTGYTARWGDTAPAFQDPNATSLYQPNISDVSACVDTFKGTASAIPMPRCDLVGGANGLPNFRVQIDDIAAIVDAFKSRAYPFSGTSSPVNCP